MSSNSVQEIIANAPCILHIESADLIYEELSVMATASAGMMQSATTVEDVIYSNLQQFLYDLYEELTNKVQKQHVSLNDCFIIVMLSCTSWSKMSENMKSLFPLTIKVTVNDSFVNYLDSFVQLEEKIMAQRENNWKETSSSMHIVEQSSEKHPFSSMFQHSLSKIRSIIDEKGKNSFLYCNTLINSVQYAHLTRIHKDKWFSNCGFDDLLSEKDSNHKSNDDSVDLKECAIRDVAIAVESSLFLNSYQSMEVKGIYSIDSKASSNVAPVFWSDIGGLDR